MRTHTFKRVALGGVAASMLFGGSAFTASNTVPTSNAGAGTATVSGYTAETIDYTLNSTDPTKIDSVAIDITGAVTGGSTAQLQLATSGAWYSCTIGALVDPDGIANNGDETTPLTCTTTGAAVDTANDLTLVIAD